jgi:hypothetical protein
MIWPVVKKNTLSCEDSKGAKKMRKNPSLAPFESFESILEVDL